MTLLGLVIFITTSSKDLPHSLRFALGQGPDVYAAEDWPLSQTQEASKAH